MTSCIDTTVLSALLAAEPTAPAIAKALNTLRRAGPLIIHGSVYAELLAAPGNTQDHLGFLLQRGQIQVGWNTSETVWQMSGQAYAAYARRRAKSGGGQPRRILADFLIGAHALSLGATLVTLDAQYPTVSGGGVWDGINRVIKLQRHADSRLNARTSSRKPIFTTLHARRPCAFFGHSRVHPTSTDHV